VAFSVDEQERNKPVSEERGAFWAILGKEEATTSLQGESMARVTEKKRKKGPSLRIKDSPQGRNPP